jgi:valyl-tRNA synthetase
MFYVWIAAPAGRDITFTQLAQPGEGFTNKIWNAFKLIKGWEVSIPNNQNLQRYIEWYEAKLKPY